MPCAVCELLLLITAAFPFKLKVKHVYHQHCIRSRFSNPNNNNKHKCPMFESWSKPSNALHCVLFPLSLQLCGLTNRGVCVTHRSAAWTAAWRCSRTGGCCRGWPGWGGPAGTDLPPSPTPTETCLRSWTLWGRGRQTHIPDQYTKS